MRLRSVVGAVAGLCATASILAGGGAAGAATVSPSLGLSPTSAAAASTQNLGTTIDFSYSDAPGLLLKPGDTVRNLTLQLPPGLIANAAIDNGQCLKDSSPDDTNCRVGSGTITATATVLNLLSVPNISLSAHFDLVKPPSARDLAGLQVVAESPTNPGAGYTPLGGVAPISLRPDGGLDILLSDLPNTYELQLGSRPLTSAKISVSQIKSTFDGLRFPSTCPATPARVTVTTSSYEAGAATTSAPLAIHGCGSAPYSPSFRLSARRDAKDSQVSLTTTISQAADELTSRSTALVFPSRALVPNLGVAKALCPTVGPNCQAIGSATAVSPLYPRPLAGQAYLTGSSVLTPDITLVFPPPFSLTLSGAVSLAKNSTTFTGLPDIPLTRLAVTLNGGAQAAFSTTCTTATGTATAQLVSQNGDRTVTDASKFTVAGWKACASGGGGSGGSGGASGGGGGSGGSGGGGSGRGGDTSPGFKGSRPTLTGAAVSGLRGRRPAVHFTLTKGRHGGRISTVTIGLGKGLAFARHHIHGRLRVRGVHVAGARIGAMTLSHRRLVVHLRKPAKRIAVTLGSRTLHESGHLLAEAKHHGIKQLPVNVTVRDAKGVVSKLHLKIHELGLSG